MTDILNFFLSNVFLAALVGFFSSLFCYLFLFRFKPKVVISNQIAKGKDLYGERTYFRIKVVNLTRHPVIDINAQLHIVKSYFVDGKEIYNTRQVKLVRNNPLVIGKFSKTDERADYAYRFVTEADILQLFENPEVKALKFRMLCKNGFSNFGGFFEKDFTRDSVKEGDFEKGYSFEIKCRDPIQGETGDYKSMKLSLTRRNVQ